MDGIYLFIFNNEMDLNENWWFEKIKKYQKTKGNALLELPVKFEPKRITECGDIVKSVKNIQCVLFFI